MIVAINQFFFWAGKTVADQILNSVFPLKGFSSNVETAVSTPLSPALPLAMASVAGRKKSVISGLHIDTNANSNTLLNKAASQSTSLYQQCSSLKSRLMRIRGFPPYFSQTSPEDSRQSTDPVTQLWDLFTLGTPLCYIFDRLPVEAGFDKINNSEFNQSRYAANPDNAKKHAIALFAMKIRKEDVMQSIPGCEPFTVTDLWDRNSTDGFVKVCSFFESLMLVTQVFPMAGY